MGEPGFNCTIVGDAGLPGGDTVPDAPRFALRRLGLAKRAPGELPVVPADWGGSELPTAACCPRPADGLSAVLLSMVLSKPQKILRCALISQILEDGGSHVAERRLAVKSKAVHVPCNPADFALDATSGGSCLVKAVPSLAYSRVCCRRGRRFSRTPSVAPRRWLHFGGFGRRSTVGP